jgi:hypothetical protein
MSNTEMSGVLLKSNITLKSRGIDRPIDNMPNEYFDVRINVALTNDQRAMKLKMLFWADKIYDENNNIVKDDCYNGCVNCCQIGNYCKRPKNIVRACLKSLHHLL